MSATGSLLVVYDDASFAALIAASRTRRGGLDIDALTRSSDEEIFDGAFLEGVHSAAVGTPRVSSLTWARPEKVAQLLISAEPLLASSSWRSNRFSSQSCITAAAVWRELCQSGLAVGTLRREYLDHLLFWNAADLERKLELYGR